LLDDIFLSARRSIEMLAVPSIPGVQIRSRLGLGSICEVWAGKRGHQSVAVKVLRPDYFTDAAMRATIAAEITLGSAIEHDHIVSVLDGDVGDASCYVVQNRVTGYSLGHILDRDGPLPGWLIADILGQIGSALAMIHSIGYVHGDVKPDNILLDTSGHATLIDLGFAREPGTLPFGEGILGTPNYLAPELCHRAFVDTPAADMFSLGLSAYELLTGEMPYPRFDDTESTLLAHRDDDPATLSLFEFDREIAVAVNAMLSRELHLRPKAAAIAKQFGHRAPQRRAA
jgi:eukaryotic-like serine/threonine-protein kinase